MNIYEKLQKCRVELQSKDLKKSGHNTAFHYRYYELSDFLPAVNIICLANKICCAVSFGAEIATLTVTDAEKPEDNIVFISPLAEANLKGCTPIQGLGAVQTYLRRYLYSTAFEIVEHDALDGTLGADKAPTQPQNNKGNTNIPPKQTKPPRKDVDPDNLFCVNCEKQIEQKVYSYSMDKHKKPLCFKCQSRQAANNEF